MRSCRSAERSRSRTSRFQLPKSTLLEPVAEHHSYIHTQTKLSQELQQQHVDIEDTGNCTACMSACSGYSRHVLVWFTVQCLPHLSARSFHWAERRPQNVPEGRTYARLFFQPPIGQLCHNSPVVPDLRCLAQKSPKLTATQLRPRQHWRSLVQTLQRVIHTFEDPQTLVLILVVVLAVAVALVLLVVAFLSPRRALRENCAAQSRRLLHKCWAASAYLPSFI